MNFLETWRPLDHKILYLNARNSKLKHLVHSVRDRTTLWHNVVNEAQQRVWAHCQSSLSHMISTDTHSCVGRACAIQHPVPCIRSGSHTSKKSLSGDKTDQLCCQQVHSRQPSDIKTVGFGPTVIIINRLIKTLLWGWRTASQMDGLWITSTITYPLGQHGKAWVWSRESTLEEHDAAKHFSLRCLYSPYKMPLYRTGRESHHNYMCQLIASHSRPCPATQSATSLASSVLLLTLRVCNGSMLTKLTRLWMAKWDAWKSFTCRTLLLCVLRLLISIRDARKLYFPASLHASTKIIF